MKTLHYLHMFPMPTKPRRQMPVIRMPIQLDQLADGLRRLSPSDLMTLELLLGRRAMRTIRRGLKDVKNGRVIPFRTR